MGGISYNVWICGLCQIVVVWSVVLPSWILMQSHFTKRKREREREREKKEKNKGEKIKAFITKASMQYKFSFT
jgi:hypothetical protein